MNGLNFVAIDFETASSDRDSACSVSLVRVRDGQIVKQYSTLINPECDFSPFNTLIHHITPEMVIDAPTFPEIVPALRDFIGDDILVAHNTTFDIDVLNSMFLRYDLNAPHFDSLCTVQAARRAYPNLPNHKLKTLCRALGISLDNHHDAACDACACANVLITIAEQLEATTFEELSDKLDMNIDFVIRRRQELARLQAQREKEAKAAAKAVAKAAKEAERAAKLAEKEARRLEREARRAQREAEKAAAAERGPVTRAVVQCTDDGTIVQEFPSVAQAASTIGVDKKCIRDAANGKQKHAAGYCWAWSESIKNEESVAMAKATCYNEADMLLDALKASKPDKAFTFEYIQMKDGRTISFKVAGGILFYLVSTRQGSYIRTDSAQSLFQLFPNAQPLANDNMKIPLDENFDIDVFVNYMGPRCEELFDDSATMQFGCCNDFILCSDMKRCLYLEIPDRRGCYYRKNLEAGRIFYGKNKTI